MAARKTGGAKFKSPQNALSKIGETISAYRFQLIMALVAAVILAGGYLLYHFQEQQMRQRTESGLLVIAESKADQISEWRAARLVDANTLAGSPSFTDTVAEYIATPTDNEARDKVLADLAIVAQSYPYQDILLVDIHGNVLLSVNNSVRRLSDMTLTQLPVAIKEHQAVFIDFHYPPDSDSPHLNVIAPLFPWRQDSPTAIGAVVLYIDPSRYLYPLVQSFPIPSQTGEAMLVERDGDQALFLNELRHQQDTALKLRIPLSRQDVPAVMTVLGKEGVFEGRDYREVEVLSATEHIPDSPWYLVAKIDASEALATWRSRSGFIIASVAGLMAAALALVGLIWQRRQRQAYQSLYQAELKLRESQERSRALIENSQDAITLLAADGTVLYDSPSIVRILGYDPTERIGRSVFDFVHPDQRQGMANGFVKFTQQTGAVVRSEVPFLHKDGTVRWIEGIRSNLLQEPAIKAIVVNYRDITERKRAEEALKHLNLTLHAIRDVNQLISKEKDRDHLLGGICRCLVESRGYLGVWIVIMDESAKLITYAQAGFGSSFLSLVEQLKKGILPVCAQQALRQPEVVVIPDQQSSCCDCPIISAKPDIKGALTIRLEHSNTVYGLLSAVMPPDFMTDEEIRLFRELADDCAFALYDIDLQDKHKEAEEALRRSEQNFRESIENSPLGIRIVAADGETIYANRALLDICGFNSIDELKATPTRDRYMPESYAEHRERIEKRNRGEFVPLSYEISIVRKDGEVRHLAVSRGQVQWNGQMQYQVAYQDITLRKRAEEALQRSEERYRTILEGMDDSYYEVDLAGNFTFVNDALCRRLGHSREKLIGMNYRAYTPREISDSTFKTFNKVYRTGEPVKGVPSAAIAADGSLIFTERSVFPLRNDQGKIIGFRGISRDVTEHKLAEENRAQLELKAQIASRLASVGEMAAGVAHEINNPLTAVTGYAQLLVEREDVPTDIRSDLEAINDGARRVAGIVQRLLAFSRQTKPQRKYVDINDLIESTLILRAYHLRVNNIEVVTRLCAGLLETVVDPGQIQQVILNLIVNAETEMKLAHGKGKLTITTRKIDNIIKITVKDNGPGIKPEVMDKIFNPFFTTREVGQGTGLGLSLCYGIITEHKGKIYVESKRGKGATFVIELPVVREVAPPMSAKLEVKKLERAPKKARILVVDDEQVVRDVVKRVLTADGHKVEAADNAADALNKIEDKKYSLILVDIKMPGMNGVEMFERIRKIDKSLAGKVVFITGDIMGADTDKFLSETKVPHISKPFNAEQLKILVARALAETDRK